MKNLYLFAFLFISLMLDAQSIDKTLEWDGITRQYRVYLPADFDETQSLPLVFNFHGYGSSNVEQVFYSQFNDVADEFNFILVYPMGLEDNTGTTHFNSYFGTSDVDDVGFTSHMIDRIYTDYNIDLTRVYSTGMSNGGFMSYRLACELSDRIAAVASVTGSMAFPQFDNCTPSRPVPTMEIHGTLDATVPYNGATGFIPPIQEVVDFWVTQNKWVMRTPLI